MHWFLLLIVSASAVWAQFPLPMPTRPTSFPLSPPTRGGEVRVWGWGGGITPPIGLNGVVQIASGNACEVALKADGTVVAWGNTDNNRIAVPSGLTDVVQVAMNGAAIHGLALKSSGEVVSWGTNQWGAAVVPADLGPVVQVAVGGNMSAALLADGTVRVWGFNDSGSLRPPDGLDRVVRISAGWLHILALRDDGTVVTWGHRDGVPSPLDMPSGLQDVVQIAAGSGHSLALKRDGTVVQWPPPWPVPNLSNTVSVAAGTQQFLALASNGVVTAWGGPYGNNAPTDLTDVFQLSCGNDHNAVLFGALSEPALLVQYSAATTLINNAPAQAFDAALLASTTPARIYTLQNSGNAPLSNLAVAKSGADTSHFILTTPTTNALAPGASTTFSVSFAPTSSGSHTAQISITSNDSNNSPFVINLSGFGLGEDLDTDGDGLNDAAEFTMSALGFDWQSNQPTLVTALYSNANRANLFTQSQYDDNRARGREDGIADVIVSPTAYGLYDSTSIMDLRMGGLMIQKHGTDATIVFQPQTTTDLAAQPFTNNGTPVTNTIPMPGRKGFLRINAQPHPTPVVD
jgi:hypothetical protein